ncbi:hypothetical protein RB195_014559 [Necator americanus]|uniref:Uncharacterized protein n=1 Tax=Necator americanus TaxID=51031 RepID=A0ABR1E0Q5_NECAM
MLAWWSRSHTPRNRFPSPKPRGEARRDVLGARLRWQTNGLRDRCAALAPQPAVFVSSSRNRLRVASSAAAVPASALLPAAVRMPFDSPALEYLSRVGM